MAFAKQTNGQFLPRTLWDPLRCYCKLSGNLLAIEFFEMVSWMVYKDAEKQISSSSNL
jgi:hypothetical protein